MQELRIKVQPSEVEMILGFISLLKKQGMFARVEPEIVDIVKKEGKSDNLELLEEERMKDIESVILQRINDIDTGKAKVLSSEEFKNKIEKWKNEKLK